jgi:hypothetical protein
VHLADSRKEYFLFNWINLNAERARYPCSLFAEIRGKRGKGGGDKLCKLVILVEAALSCFFLSLSHAREVGRLESVAARNFCGYLSLFTKGLFTELKTMVW